MYEITRGAVGLLGAGAELASHGVKRLHYHMQDTYYNPVGPLSRTGIPAVAFHYESGAYNALNAIQQARVRQYMPWSPEYAGLTPAQQDTVNKRNRTNREINRLTEPIRRRPNYQRTTPIAVAAYYRRRDRSSMCKCVSATNA